jgi:hypothetical protein
MSCLAAPERARKNGLDRSRKKRPSRIPEEVSISCLFLSSVVVSSHWYNASSSSQVRWYWLHYTLLCCALLCCTADATLFVMRLEDVKGVSGTVTNLASCQIWPRTGCTAPRDEPSSGPRSPRDRARLLGADPGLHPPGDRD